MPTFTLDGKELTVEQGTTVLKAALANGVQIPHFCFHPHLSVDGSCRMCQVEVEKMPKLAISCDTLVADGMVVKTTSEKVLKARNAVMEYLLLNHPLDCPICDQAGECKLQEYSVDHGQAESDFAETKVHKPKA
ncbi:MAG: NADH-quinone oxidoreductase subunit G, partial [Deltaproteobacteria bacterium]|nr:NADH-quinone oxidoreductase subunit G [Deltaproteobacteria bacterium]